MQRLVIIIRHWCPSSYQVFCCLSGSSPRGTVVAACSMQRGAIPAAMSLSRVGSPEELTDRKYVQGATASRCRLMPGGICEPSDSP